MSKRELNKYLKSLSKKELENQINELYDRIKEVKGFYNFVFNPKEDKLIEEAKFKIGKEYFPPANRKPKRRRSVAQKIIKKFQILGVEPTLIIDVMLYNIEVAQAFCAEKEVNQDAFYLSMLKSFQEAITFANENNLRQKFDARLQKINQKSFELNWINRHAFDDALH